MSSQTLKFEILSIDKNDLETKSLNQVQKLVEKRLNNLNTGDLVIMSSYDRIKHKTEHLSEAKFHLVYSVNSEKCLADLKSIPDIYNLAIPLEITKNLAESNPKINIIKSYTQLYNLGLKEYKNCFNSIELDFKTHLEYLPDDLNLDPVILNHGSLFYFFTPPADLNNNTAFIKIDENFYAFLNKNRLESYLETMEIETEIEIGEDGLNESINLDSSQVLDESCIPEKERDHEVEDFAKQFKKIYENDFRIYLKNLKPNEPLNATSLPQKKYNKETYDEDSGESVTLVFYFEKLDLDENGNINLVETSSFDKTEKCFFSPFLCKDYGPYFKTNLLCSFYNVGRSKNQEAQNFFLDLPIDLYNLIE
ncbi:unnamed protein product [Brachionus calyciflorus]|uniref:Uncharacterized protein n=1 Tax=Brachionus calyciflorus TaxID=104777 RepID=A0A814G3M1_9BILA|nr:unnamed protein product [Brachionus calyciflorus]